MSKEELILKKRLIELSKVSFERDIVTFSDFMNLNELNIFHNMTKGELYGKYKLFGGYELAERQMVAFLPDALCYDYIYPFDVLKVAPTNKRFADDLSHRDYLGSMMNLGIERCKIGDIIVDKDVAYIFITNSLSSFVIENLMKIKHTIVNVSICNLDNINFEPKFEVIKGNIPSIRLDTIIAATFPMSRNKVTPLIEAGRVFINGKLVTSNGHPLKDGDIISVRKIGKLCFDGTLSTSKKGRLFVQIKKYV
ncbi:MAG: YlmH/Sll1252 family protein [Suipraeoptans sp.]